MQTFLPYADFALSARCLDRQRLGKQRVETLQLLRAISEPAYGWRNHPAAKMWAAHGHALAEYGVAMCDEWLARGYKDTCRDKIIALSERFPADGGSPLWLGDEAIHASHRSNLLRKSPEFYGQFGWTECTEDPYVWPV
jgi:hypothetical protein